jgi:hypothetical protein
VAEEAMEEERTEEATVVPQEAKISEVAKSGRTSKRWFFMKEERSLH